MTDTRCVCGHANTELHHYFTNSARHANTPTNTDQCCGDRAATLGDQLATGARMNDYGHPRPAFDRIAGLWSAYLNCPGITCHDVAAMMILLKTSRLATNPHKSDTRDDIEGYVATLRMLDCE